MKNKILVCIHIYYHNQVDYIIEKLKSIKGLDYDLFVTYVEENNETKEKFLNFNKNAKFKIVKNKGYDIYPFLVLINEIDLEKYSCILKLHTKNHDKLGSYSWRDNLYNNLLETKTIFRKNIKKLKKYGIICAENRIAKMEDNWAEDTWLFEDVCKQIGIKPTKAKFCAGTIFLAKIEIIKRIKELNLLQLDFENKAMETGSNSTNAHVVERLFGVVCKQLGYEIYGSNQRKIFSDEWNKKVFDNIFSVKNKGTYKYITILWFSIKLNRYNYPIIGNKNTIYLTENKEMDFLRKKTIKGLQIKINGNENMIKISKSAKFINCELIITTDDNNVIIEDNVKLENCTLIIEKNCEKKLKIERNSTLKNKKITMSDKYEELALDE